MHLTNPGLPWLLLLQQHHLEHIASAVRQAGEERAGNIVVQLLSASVWKEHVASPHILLGKTSHLAAPDFSWVRNTHLDIEENQSREQEWRLPQLGEEGSPNQAKGLRKSGIQGRVGPSRRASGASAQLGSHREHWTGMAGLALDWQSLSLPFKMGPRFSLLARGTQKVFQGGGTGAVFRGSAQGRGRSSYLCISGIPPQTLKQKKCLFHIEINSL